MNKYSHIAHKTIEKVPYWHKSTVLKTPYSINMHFSMQSCGVRPVRCVVVKGGLAVRGILAINREAF